MKALRFKLDIVWLFALLASTFFAYSIAKEFWVGVAGVLGGIVVVLVGISRPLLLTMAWLVGMPTLFVFGNEVLASIPILNVDRAVYLVVAGFFLARLIFRPDSLQKPSAAEKAMALYLAIILVSWATTVGEKPFRELREDIVLLLEAFFMPYTAFVLARNVDWTPALVKACLFALLFVAAYQVMAGFAQYLFDLYVFHPQRFNLQHDDRLTGSFVNSLPYGILMSIFFFLILFLYLYSKDPLLRIALVGLGVAVLLCIVLSKGRGAWLGLVVGCVYVFLHCPRIRPVLGPAAVVALLGGPLVLPFVADLDALSARLTDAAPIFNRVALYATSIEMFKDRPWFGFGFGMETFNNYKGLYYESWAGVPAQYAAVVFVPHNEFLRIMVMMGLPGLLAYLLLLWTLYRPLAVAARRFAESDPFTADLAVFLLAGFLVILVNMMFLDMMGVPPVLITSMFLYGMGIRLAELRADAEGAAEGTPEGASGGVPGRPEEDAVAAGAGVRPT